MTSRRTRTIVPYSAEEMFDLVADVRRYPEFIPHCVALRVLESDVDDGQGSMIAEMVVAYAAFREKFKSRVLLDKRQRRVEADYVEGPFKQLYTLWRFADMEDGCEVDFIIDFEFKNAILQTAASVMFERAFGRMADAFVSRAHQIYGGL